MRSESEPWQPTTSSAIAIGLPNPSPPLPPPFLTCATASHHTTPLSPNRAVRPSDFTESPPLPLCLPPIGQWQQPQAEHSGEPLGDPSARVFEVFLIVSQSVSHFKGLVYLLFFEINLEVEF